MIKRKLRKALSIFLVIMLVATTFFVFDPEVLKLDVNAATESGNTGSMLSAQRAYAPEMVYLKPGSAGYFGQFCSINPLTGEAASSNADSDIVSFSNEDASEVKIFINNFWYRSSRTDYTYEDAAIGDLHLNDVSDTITKAGVTGTSAGGESSAVASGATVIASGQTSAQATINTSSRISNAVQGRVYFIEWVVQYKIGDNYHYTYMYTGIYCPVLDLTGATANGKHTSALTNIPKASGFAFVTGAMAYADSGNRSHNYTKGTEGAYAAPLVQFAGQQNNPGNFSIPGVVNGWSSTENFPAVTSDKAGRILVVPDTYDAHNHDDNFSVWTNYSDFGTWENLTPTGTNNIDVSEYGGTGYTGMGYIVVDSSRFNDYNQIPYLSAGYVRYYHDRGSGNSSLDYIRCQTQIGSENDTSHMVPNVTVSVDSNNYDDGEDKHESRTWGLYKINGPIYDGGFILHFHYTEDISMYDYPIQLNFGVGIHTTKVDKSALRKVYSNYLNSTIDKVNVDLYAAEQNSMSYSAYYNQLKSHALLLCDPTAAKASVDSQSFAVFYQNTNNWNKNNENEDNSDVSFIVPEIIYLKPNMNSGSSETSEDFQWYVGSEIDTDNYDETLTTGETQNGEIFFKYNETSNVEITYKYLHMDFAEGFPANNGTISINGNIINPINATDGSYFSSVGSCFKGRITSGRSPVLRADEQGCIIEWTAIYTDNADGNVKSAKAYTFVYKPYVQQVGAAMRTVNGSSQKLYGQDAVWISGINKVTGTGNYYPNAGTFAMFSSSASTGVMAGSKYLQLTQSFNLNPNDRPLLDYVSPSQCSPFKDPTIYYSSYEKSGSALSSDYNVYQLVTAPESRISVDTSRYTNFNQIPNLTIGMFVTDNENAKYGAWYVADATGINEESFRTGGNQSSSESQSLWERHNDTIAQSTGSISSPAEEDSLEGIKYNGGWNKNVQSGNYESLYRIKFAYYNKTSRSSGRSNLNVGVVPVIVNGVDKSSLRTTIREITAQSAYLGIDKQNSSIYNYMPEDWNRFITAYREAYYTLITFDVSASDVALAVDKLTAAYQKLVNATEFDVSSVMAALNRYAGLVSGDYTQSSWTVLQNAVNAAQNADIYGHRALVSEVNILANDVFNAINSLVSASKADYSRLDNAIAQANACDSSMYTNESWSVLEAALETALDIDRTLSADNQSIIDDVTDNLIAAVCALVLKSPDLSGLESVVSYAEDFDSELYTAESWSVLETALESAYEILDNSDEYYEQSEIDMLISNIRNAVNSLVYKSADYSALNNAAAAAAVLDSELYTEESWQALENALNAAEYGLDITHQSEVDAMAEAINNALNGLVLVEHGCTEHSWSDWYIVVNPTVNTTGLMRRDCDNCDEFETMVIPKLLPTAVTSVKLGAKSIAISMGDTIILAADVLPATAENQNITWISTDPSVVTVNNSGRVSAVSVGVANIIVKSEENPGIMDYCMVRVASLVTCNTTSVVDNDSGLIYGLSANLSTDSIGDYVELIDSTTSIVVESQSIGTGTEINVVRDDKVLDTYTAVIFGDANGDSWYDGTDSIIVNCLANGLLSREQVGEAVYMAADCNHDDVIDETDVALLEQAGLILASVDQSKSPEELVTDSAYVEYLNLIDQNPTEETPVDEATDVAPTDEPVDEEFNKSFIERLIDFIIYIVNLMKTFIIKF